MFIFTLVLCRANVFVLCLGPQRKVCVCVVMLFYSQTVLLHKTADVVGMRVGLIGMRKGFILVFTLCNRHCY